MIFLSKENLEKEIEQVEERINQLRDIIDSKDFPYVSQATNSAVIGLLLNYEVIQRKLVMLKRELKQCV